MSNIKPITAREMLNGGLDPMNIDLSEIKILSNSMPKDGNIELNNAEVLATKYVRGMDLCSEMSAIAAAHVQKTDTLKKKAYSTAALVKSSKSGIKTDKSKAWFADMDDDFVEASNKHAEAVAFLKWINSKLDSFKMMHYLCKKILDHGYAHEKVAGWNSSLPDENDTGGEEAW